MRKILAVCGTLVFFGSQVAFAGTTAFATGDRGSGAYELTVSIDEGVKVGNGTPSTTMNGEDAYIEGTLEVDGTTDLDGNLTVAGTVAGTGNITTAAKYGSTTADSIVVYQVVVSTSLVDTLDYSVAAVNAKNGWGQVWCGGEWAAIEFTSAGAVTISSSTANVTTTNGNDSTLNIYDAGTTIAIENQLGSAKTARAILFYEN